MSPATDASSRSIGIYGGSFDPVHFGHLRTALEVCELLDLEAVRFLPSRLPPHREAPRAGPDLRVQMLEAAVAEVGRFSVDQRELQRTGPSYTIDTLISLHHELPGQSFVLILGMDAFLGLPDWHRAEELADYTHFMVAHRPGWQPPDTGVLGSWLATRQTRVPSDLATGAGRIYVHPVTALDISSTAIRERIAGGGDPRFLVPESVREVLTQSNCYV